MKVLMMSVVFALLSLYAVAGCENSTLVVHAKSGQPIKVYVDGSTGRNRPSAGVMVKDVTPGEHLLKVVEVYVDEYGYTKRNIIFSANINVRPSMYMDAWVEAHKGVSIHETKQPCDGEMPVSNTPADNGGANTGENSASGQQQPAGNGQTNESQMPAYSGQPNDAGNQAPPPAGNTFAAPTQGGSIANSQEKGDEYRPSATEHLPPHISDDDFEQLKSAIGQVQYETKKIDTLKSLISGKRFATSQVSQLMDQFTFESDKLDVAKLLYDRTVDKYNYGRLASNFNFDAGKQDFKKFMAGK